MPLASGEKRTRMLTHGLQCTGKPPATERNSPTPKSAKVEKLLQMEKKKKKEKKEKSKFGTIMPCKEERLRKTNYQT